MLHSTVKRTQSDCRHHGLFFVPLIFMCCESCRFSFLCFFFMLLESQSMLLFLIYRALSRSPFLCTWIFNEKQQMKWARNQNVKRKKERLKTKGKRARARVKSKWTNKSSGCIHTNCDCISPNCAHKKCPRTKHSILDLAQAIVYLTLMRRPVHCTLPCHGFIVKQDKSKFIACF